MENLEVYQNTEIDIVGKRDAAVCFILIKKI